MPTENTSGPQTGHIVVGGGIIGWSVAARLADLGQPVTVIDPGPAGPAGQSASSRSLGWVNDAAPAPDSYHQLRRLGAARLSLAQNRSQTRFYHASGCLHWSVDGLQSQPNTALEALNETVSDAAVRLADTGQNARLINAAEAVGVEPRLDGAELGAPVLYVASDGWVDLPTLIAALSARSADLGARTVQSPVSRLDWDGERVTGVQTASGEHISAPSVVVATGAGLPGLAATADLAVPQDTTTGVTVVTDPLPAPPRIVLRAPGLMARPTPDGRLVVVAPVLEAAVSANGRVPSASVDHVLADLSRLLDTKTRLRADRVLVGPRPIPAGGLPVVGKVSNRPGLALAFSHSAATVGLVIGELLADELVTGRPSPVLADFRPERFAPAAFSG
ncbi:MAG: FAD-binding oxidoreductase [Bifidobacteriaceae bacterium]|jgi:glycine/D-amino acid oxidase-like deaminating enzyme|nr:FAD-binding oxidoreductase [Bifidobacteriaceae bacterium]